MAIITGGNVIRLTLRATYLNQQIRNVLHYEALSSPPYQSDLDQFGTAWQAAVKPAWLAVHAPGYTLDDLFMEEVAHDADFVPTRIRIVQNDLDLLGNPGTGGTSTLPPQVAGMLILRTGQPGSKNRGRIFFSAMPDTFQDDGALTGAGILAYNTLSGILDNPITAGTPPTTTDWGLTVLSRKAAALQPITTDLNNLSRVVTNITVGAITGVKNSRRIGRGM